MSKAQSTQRRRLSKQELYEQHWGEWKSMNKIAREMGISSRTLHKRASEMGMQTRPVDFRDWLVSMLGKDILYELYWGQLLTLKEIAEPYGRNHSAIRYALEAHGIPIRGKGHTPNHPSEVDPRFMEAPHRSEMVLNELLNEQRMSQTEAAEELDVHVKTVAKWAARNGIYSKGVGPM